MLHQPTIEKLLAMRKRHPRAVWTDYVELTKMGQVGTCDVSTWGIRGHNGAGGH